jgi:hypothetical protein
MTLPDLTDLRYGDGIYSDPAQVTLLARQLNNANSRAVANSVIVKPDAGLLYGFTVSSVSAQFIQVFDLTAVPADGVVPLLSFAVTALQQLGVAWIPPRGFSNGIVLCNSTTQHTKTIGTANCIFDAQFL